MASREEMLAEIKSLRDESGAVLSATPNREEMISEIKSLRDSKPAPEKSYDWSNVPRDLARSTIDALPIYGQAAGSILGNAGAGAGQAIGNSLKQGINSLIDKPLSDNLRMPTPEQALDVGKDAAMNFGTGAALNIGGQAIGRGLEAGAKTKVGQMLLSNRSAAAPTASVESAVNATQSQSANAAAQSSALSGASVSGGKFEATQGGKLFDFKAPRTLDELSAWKPSVETGEVLGKTRLKEIESIVPNLEAKPLNYHYDMMENPKAMKELKIQFENLPTKSAKDIARYNQEIVNESGRKVKDLVTSISKSEPKSMGDAGEHLMNSVKQVYSREKDMLAPVFEELKQTGGALSKDESINLIGVLTDKTKAGKLLNINPEGRFILNPNTPKSGLSDQEHGVFKRVVDDLNDGATFEEVQRIRDFLRKAIDPMNPGATAELGKVRSIMLDSLEGMAGARGDNVHKTFKAYAQNERARESIEQVIGGKIDSLDAMFAANPEKVVSKIFSNPNHAKVVESYVGPEVMSDMVSSYVNNGVKGAYDSATGFNPVKLRQWIKSNNNFIDNYVDPKAAQELSALADYGYYGKRFLDEVNPSGTAASLKAMIEPKGFFQKVKSDGIQSAVVSAVESKVGSAITQRQAISAANKSLGAPVEESIIQKVGKDLSTLKASPESMGNLASKVPNTIQSKTAALLLPKVANKDTKKGAEKWANDGAEKIQQHDSGFTPTQIEQIKKSKKGRDLLIKASDLQPNSKAMKQIVEQIRSSSIDEGEE